MPVVHSYREAGVDLDEARRTVIRVARAAATTHTPAVLAGVGGFGGLFRFDARSHRDPVLVASTDGVGSKVKVAVALGRHDSIGVDLVNQSLNDVIVTGADPLFFLDYLAVGALRAEVVEEIVGGIARACAAGGVALIGGETAQLPDLYAGDDYDLAGFMVGVVRRAEMIDGRKVRARHVVLGLPSSGLHTNGYTLARRVLPEETWHQPMPGGLGSIGDALLEPHRSYLDPIRLLRRALRLAGGDLLALAHLTGGGWVGNIPRTLPDGLGVVIETGSWTVPGIFTAIQQRGDIADEEMFRVFNLGIGMTAIVREPLVPTALDAVPEARVVGRVVRVPPGAPRVRFV